MATLAHGNDAINAIIDFDLIRIDDLERRLDALSLETSILHLQIQGKITKDEMNRLLKMLKSPDIENHVLAQEAIRNLLQTT